MDNIDIFLIVICGSGLIHGLFLSIYIGFIKNKKNNSDLFLATLLVLMAFRIGKSIIFQFDSELEILFIFLGLSTLLLVGPLLYWYVYSMISPNFKLPKYYYLQAVPFFFILFLSPFLSEQWFIDHGVFWIYVFVVSIYLHLAFYIFISFRGLYVFNKSFKLKEQKTKSQESVLIWLKYVMIGITIIWISYVINIFEKQIPYIIGPIIYSISIYLLTFKAYKLKINELSAKSFESLNDSLLIYQEVVNTIKRDELYLSSNLSLSKLSELTGFSSHKISSSINEYAKMNFNNFINHFRIEKAKLFLLDSEYEKYTISSIAFDTGFNSVSAFNSAFKKFEKITPTTFRSQSKN